MSTVLTIGGIAVDVAAGRLEMNRLTLSLDNPDSLEFTEYGVNLPGTYHPEQAVTLTDGTTTLFSGTIYSRHPDGFGTGPGRVGYRCLGLSYAASLIAVTASDGSGTMSFNLPVTDPNYVATEAGLSVGTILSQVIAQHSSQLTAIGVATDATTTSQLAALTVVSPDPIYIAGNSLWVQIQQFLQQWYGSRYALYITPAGLVRCYDTYSLTTETITLDSDPAILASINEDTSECYTQVVLRGRDWIEPAWFSLHDGTLIGEAASGGGWTSADQAAWTWADFAYPKNGYDQGTITALTSTVVTVQSDYASENWAVNFWSGIQGQIGVINPIITGMGGFQENRPITACSALSPGGTATITLAYALNNSGYTRYQIVGQPGGLNYVWRKYLLKNTYVAEHLVEMFNHSVPFTVGASNVSQVTTPIGVIQFTSAGITQMTQAALEVVPYDGTTPGYILFKNPVVQYTSTQGQLNAGGANVVAPSDVIVMVPYSRGPLTVTSPAGGGYSGTAYTGFGVQRVLYRDYPNWIDAGNNSNMQTLADQILLTVNNAIREGSVVYLGKYTNALPTGSWPIALNVAKATGTTGYESMAAPVRTVTLEWPQEGGSIWTTHLDFSTRRQMYSGDRLYVHPMFGSAGFGQQLGGTLSAGGPNFIGQSGFGFHGPEGSTANPYEGMGEDEAADRTRRKPRRTRLQSDIERNERARSHDLADADRRRGLADHAVEKDQAESGRRLQARRDAERTGERVHRQRGSDAEIVRAHEQAYGKHDADQEIVDAHRAAYGPDAEETS